MTLNVEFVGRSLSQASPSDAVLEDLETRTGSGTFSKFRDSWRCLATCLASQRGFAWEAIRLAFFLSSQRCSQRFAGCLCTWADLINEQGDSLYLSVPVIPGRSREPFAPFCFHFFLPGAAPAAALPRGTLKRRAGVGGHDVQQFKYAQGRWPLFILSTWFANEASEVTRCWNLAVI